MTLNLTEHQLFSTWKWVPQETKDFSFLRHIANLGFYITGQQILAQGPNLPQLQIVEMNPRASQSHAPSLTYTLSPIAWVMLVSMS